MVYLYTQQNWEKKEKAKSVVDGKRNKPNHKMEREREIREDVRAPVRK